MNNKTNKNSFSLRNILKTSYTQCNLFFYLFLMLHALFCVKFCSSTCPLLWLVLFRCIHLTDLLYWCCKYLSILQDILNHIWYDPGYTYLKSAVTTKIFNFVFLTIVFLTISCNLLNMKRRPYPFILARLFWAAIWMN